MIHKPPASSHATRRRVVGFLVGAVALVTSATTLAETPTLLVIQGAPGQDEYGEMFTQWRQRFEAAGKQGGATVHAIAAESDDDKATLQKLIADQPKESPAPLWLVFIGHGTFDGNTAKFNLRGPDVSAEELSEWLAPFNRPIVAINCASSSAPFLAKLGGPDRVVVTATKSGYEMNFARFGEYLSRTVASPEADLDKDGQTSLLEAFLLASRHTQEFYDADARLATEQALLDDNADGLGTPAAFFRGVRAVKKAREDAIADGLRAHQLHLVPSPRERNMPAALREQRNALELKLEQLRDRKGDMAEDVYFVELEKLAVELAKLHEDIDAAVGESNKDASKRR